MLRQGDAELRAVDLAVDLPDARYPNFLLIGVFHSDVRREPLVGEGVLPVEPTEIREVVEVIVVQVAREVPVRVADTAVLKPAGIRRRIRGVRQLGERARQERLLGEISRRARLVAVY